MAGFLAMATGACAQADSADAGRQVQERSVSGPGPSAAQHLLVVTEDPGDIGGRLFRMERVGGGESGGDPTPGEPGEPGQGAWRQVGDPIHVVVGRSGVGPKREGDGRSPEGVFELGPLFGYGQEPPAVMDVSAETSFPYQSMAPGAVCVDDPASAYYNRVFDPDTLAESAAGAPEWNSFEAMRRDLVHGDDLYKWGVLVRYNDSTVPGAGSCIFLHIWRSPDSPTAGCTAMAEEDLLSVLGWLKRGPAGGPEVESQTEVEPSPGFSLQPLLVQGTRAYLEGLASEGVLPYRIPPSS